MKYNKEISYNWDEINNSPVWHNELPWNDSNNNRWGSAEPIWWLRTTYNRKDKPKDGLWFKYGRIDTYAIAGQSAKRIRCAAIWLLNLEQNVNEVDILEYMADPDRMVFSQWWGYNPHKGKSKSYRCLKKKAKVITKYSLIWKKRYMVWLINNFPVYISFRKIPKVPMAIIVNDLENLNKIVIKSNNFYNKLDI